MPVKAAVFDVGGVLESVDDDTWPQAWLARWESEMGFPCGYVSTQLARKGPTGDETTGELTEQNLRSAYAEALGLDDAQADQMMAEMWDDYCGVLDLVMRDFVAGLRPRLTTAILSNSADGARREEQRRYGFEQLTDVLVYSHEVGIAKPDPAIFELTESLVVARPDEIVFLDDNEGHVAAAAKRGWHAVLHRSTQKSIQEITRLMGRP